MQKTFKDRKIRVAVLTALVGWTGAGTVQAFDSGSTGADGVLNPVASQEIALPASGILQYSNVTIPTNVTVTFAKNTLNTPVQILVSGNMSVGGKIDIRGHDAKPTGTAGGGSLADDGIPGDGGPGGFAGGAGGTVPAGLGGAGLGPGGGLGGNTHANGCVGGTYYHYYGKSGAYATAGSTANYNSNCSSSGTASAALPYGSSMLTPLIGGSGGGGGLGGTSFPGGGGGGGGGAILIAVTGTLTLNGTIDATGGDGTDITGSGIGGPGAGGSGGAIKIAATNFAGTGGKLLADGGCRTVNGTRRQECGLNQVGGSAGRIRVEADTVTYSGTSSPPFATGAPTALVTSNLPNLAITTVAGFAVPTVPTGNADLQLPANVTNPVTVVCSTTNIPPGGTITVRMTPQHGDYVEKTSPAITGSFESGTATITDIPLPQGPSVLQAVVSYTVTVAQGQALSQYARNERVERVELVAAPGREAQAELITVSGQRYRVPRSALSVVGPLS
jgi:hypothetical protein